ncbi:MAG: 3-oxoacyl-ACP reductase, partial [Myxococcales bacterium]|nr:3-oxoacyl-ACP reductase [Polyangiaceae bacterium]MDW8251435.1 3-oxoacyl-ACP reductase [Myxococcales bacterium]
MTDLLLEMSKHPRLRRAARALGLPLPEPLRRPRGPSVPLPLDGRAYHLASAPGGALVDEARAALLGAGASLAGVPLSARLDGLVLDASGVSEAGGLRALFDDLGPRVGQLAHCGRVLVLGRPEEGSATPEAALAQAALEGFVRSLAKELGRRGATVNLLRIEKGAEGRMEPVLRFLLSDGATFVTGQPLRVSRQVRGEGPWPTEKVLEGKVAVVTGAARGIGEATARALAAEGARVLCVDRPTDEHATCRLAREIGGSVVLVDVTDEEAPGKIAAAAAAMGGVDVVIHNAGVTRDRTLARMTPDEWDTVMAVNAAAPVRIQQALDSMLQAGGRVLVLSSIAGIAGNVGQTGYAASKAGVAGWVRAFAPVLALRGITANAVAPGFIETRMTAAIPTAIRQVARRL